MRRWAMAVIVIVASLLASLLVPLRAEAAAAPYRLTAFVQPDLTRGQALPIHGRVTPAARGRYVYVEVRKPGLPVWQTLRAVLVRKGGRYAAVLHPNEPGLWRYRVVKPAGNGHRRGISPVRKVTVWQWRSLESMWVDFGEPETTALRSAVTFAGTMFRPGYAQATDGIRYFALKRRCSRVDVWVGADSDSETTDASVATIRGSVAGSVYALDRTLATASVQSGGTARHLVLGADKVAGTVHLALQFSGGVEGNGLLWGRPQAYCSF